MRNTLKTILVAAVTFGTLAIAAPNEVALNRAEALATAIEELDTLLHDQGASEKLIEEVHVFELVVLDFNSLLQQEGTQQSINAEMKNVYNGLVTVIRAMYGYPSNAAQDKLTVVINAYKALFYTIYPPQGGCGCR